MNKINKIFKWVFIALLIMILIPIASFVVLFFNSEQFAFLIPVVFIITFLNAILIPIGDLILIILFFVKLFSKNKTKKDDEQIALNLISIIIYTFVTLIYLAFLFLMFISDGINT